MTKASLLRAFVEGVFVSGQTTTSSDGKPQHPGDMRAQVALSLDNVAAVLAEAGMDLSNIVNLRAPMSPTSAGSCPTRRR